MPGSTKSCSTSSNNGHCQRRRGHDEKSPQDLQNCFFSSFAFLILFFTPSLTICRPQPCDKRKVTEQANLLEQELFYQSNPHLHPGKPFRYFCNDPVQQTCKQFDFLKQPYLYLSFPIIMTRLQCTPLAESVNTPQCTHCTLSTPEYLTCLLGFNTQYIQMALA